MKIQVLGPGCPKCRRMAAVTEQAARELGVDAEIVKVTAIDAILACGVMMTPALIVDGEVKVAGRVPSLTDVKEWLAGGG